MHGLRERVGERTRIRPCLGASDGPRDAPDLDAHLHDLTGKVTQSHLRITPRIFCELHYMASFPAVAPEPKLPLDDYRRYGRQMILDGFGLDGGPESLTSSLISHD